MVRRIVWQGNLPVGEEEVRNCRWGIADALTFTRCQDSSQSLPTPIYIYTINILVFLGLNPCHMQVPRLGVKSELQLPVYNTATTTWDPICVCNLHQSSQQCWIFNPLSKARNQTSMLMDANRILFHCSTTGTPQLSILNLNFRPYKNLLKTNFSLN